MIVSNYPQGTDEWLSARRGVITGSRAKDARSKLKGGGMSDKAVLYAMDTARERLGGLAEQPYVNAAMRMGQEQEPVARAAYEVTTGKMVEEAGFITTDDGIYGCSVDGLIGDDGVWECKTIVSSKTLFTAVVDRDIGDYVDQINFSLWLLGRLWCDLVLWAPDLRRPMTIIRVERNDNAIELLEADLVAFEKVVSGFEAKLAAALG